MRPRVPGSGDVQEACGKMGCPDTVSCRHALLPFPRASALASTSEPNTPLGASPVERSPQPLHLQGPSLGEGG